MTLTGRHRHCQYSPVKSFEHGPASSRKLGLCATKIPEMRVVRSALQKPACWDLQTLSQWLLVRCPSLSISYCIGGCLRLMPLRY